MTPTADADRIIAELGLAPHPEGGYYRETFRDDHAPLGRAASTAIYFLLKAGQISRWHRVDAAEVWHHYDGAPLRLTMSSQCGQTTNVTLGRNLAAGDRPQAIVPRGHWQRAQSLGDWTLVGCTVAPGFTFDTFELAGPDFDPQPAQ